MSTLFTLLDKWNCIIHVHWNWKINWIQHSHFFMFLKAITGRNKRKKNNEIINVCISIRYIERRKTCYCEDNRFHFSFVWIFIHTFCVISTNFNVDNNFLWDVCLAIIKWEITHAIRRAQGVSLNGHCELLLMLMFYVFYIIFFSLLFLLNNTNSGSFCHCFQIDLCTSC